ncbi:hypothetical protein [Pseudomonas cichorii]|uniref:PA0061/PA0062 family lipoprotein n=1 Tax=Pseudomonas cichorii TaxID=36746 RepID=UPI0021A9C68E|nr:hypothetical protein [Pseudomonas cichorii]
MNLFKSTLLMFSILILAACSTQPSAIKKGESVVHLQAQTGNEMTARRLDQQRAQNLTQFQVSEGKHELELGLVQMGYQQSQRRCVATLAYDNFMADQRYTLIEKNSGADLHIALIDSDGKTLTQTRQVACL